jgi:iron complex outermembrane receptor protein
MPPAARPLAAALLAACPPAWAGEAPPVALERVVVTAPDEDASAAADAPAPRFGIDADAIDAFNAATADDALKYAPNLAVRRRFVGDNNAIVAVRSTSSRQSARTLVYADGLLLSNLLGSDFGFAPRWSVVDPAEIARVDVLYGPYSAAFPGNALGATVLIATRMPERFEAHADLQWMHQDFDLYGVDRGYGGQRQSAFAGSRSGAWSYLVGVERLRNTSQPLSFYTVARSDAPAADGDVAVRGARPYVDQFGRPGYVLGVNGEGETATDDLRIKAKLAYDFDAATRLALTVVDWRQDLSDRTRSFLRDADGRTIGDGAVAIDGRHYALPANAFAPGDGEGARRLYGLSLTAHPATGWRYDVTASAFRTLRDVAATAAGSGDGPGTVAYGDGSGWRTFDARADYLAAADARHHWSFGYHLDRYRLDNATYAAADWRARALAGFDNAFAGTTQTQALYVQDAWRFAPDWRLLPGLRYERWRAYDGRRAQGATRVDYAAREDAYWSPKLALERDFASGWTARLSLARAVRLPTVSELFQGRISGTALVNNDPNLKPERAFSKDLSLERAFAAGSLRLSLYEDDVRDALFSQTNTTVFPTVTNVQNVDRVRTRGQEAYWEMRGLGAGRFDLAVGAAHNDARTLANAKNPASVGKRFYRIPHWRADLVGTWHAGDAVDATLAARYSGRQYNTLDNSDVHPDTFGGTSDYFVLDARINLRLGAGLTLGIGVDNLTDRRYYVYHPYPGRTFYAEAKVAYR